MQNLGGSGATLTMYRTSNCSGESLTFTLAANAKREYSLPSYTGWDRAVESFKVTH